MDALQFAQQISPRTVQTVITSPPYWGLRDYGYADQWGSEPTMQQYITRMVKLFRAIRDALRDDGTVWLNLGDSYASAWESGRRSTIGAGSRDNRVIRIDETLKEKDLVGMPWRVALALQADGWYLRSDIIWHKPNPMPESVTDRPTKSHEYIFLLSKAERYYYDTDAIREPHTDSTVHIDKGTRGSQGYSTASGVNSRPQRDSNGGLGKHDLGRNKRTVWTVATQPFPGAHFAVFPTELITPCVLAGAPKGGLVYDPFMGAGTTALTAKIHGRDYIGSELNQEYIDLANARLDGSIKRHIAQKNAQPLEDLPLFQLAKQGA